MPEGRGYFLEFERLRGQVDHMWRRLAGGHPGRPGFCLPVLEPPADVFETADQVVVVAEIAGIGEEEVEVEVVGRPPDLPRREARSPGGPPAPACPDRDMLRPL